MLGERLKALRESKGLVQRQVAVVLGVDSAYISKMESNEKPVSRSYLPKLAILYSLDEEELQTLWLADRMYNLAKNETQAIKAIKLTNKELIKLSKRNSK